MKVAVFDSQFFQLQVILFDFKDNMLDERCNNQHPLPQ